MESKRIFVSVGSTCNPQQEEFVKAVEDRLRNEGLIPQTIGRTAFSSDAPLKAVTELTDQCSGLIVIAFERCYFPSGTEKRGGNHEKSLVDVRVATPWNHIEAAMAYSRHLPIIAIVEEGIKSEGLLEPGYDWYVLSLPLECSQLNSQQFIGILSDWKSKALKYKPASKNLTNAADMTVADLLSSLKPVQLWSLIGTLAALITGSFTLGTKAPELLPKQDKTMLPSHSLHSPAQRSPV